MPTPPDLPPGTFSLHAYAEPPVPAGAYTLGGTVTAVPGPVAPLGAQVVVTAPRYALAPDQILSTFPPAGARGAFDTALPQIVLRRRSIPWERVVDPTAPPRTPWLALVVVAEGEASLLTNVPVGDTVTKGVTLTGPADATSGACLEVPHEIVTGVFPAQPDLALLCHVRAVDLADTELALGDDDGWLAVVLANRLPQPGVRYLACLVNLEGQYGTLPAPPPHQTTFDPAIVLYDQRPSLVQRYGGQIPLDVATMRLPVWKQPQRLQPRLRPETASPGPAVSPARGPAARTGAGWAGAAAQGVQPNAPDAGTKARAVLADGFAYRIEPPPGNPGPFRFPVLAYWSFSCEPGGDFRHLALSVQSRMLGHVVTGPETPDGDPPQAGDPPPVGDPAEPTATRRLPLVDTATGHVQLDHVSRDGEPSPAWYRGPLGPAAVPRPDGADDTPPLAHVADDLRGVAPDGQEDLGRAAAFELGRLLALSQPGVAAAIARWRADAYGAARVEAVVGASTAGLTSDPAPGLPTAVAQALTGSDPLAPVDSSTGGDPEAGHRPRTVGARAARAVVTALGHEPATTLGPVRPVADPGNAAAALQGVHEGGDATLVSGLGVPGVKTDVDPATLLAQIGRAPTATAAPDPGARAALIRQRLEEAAGRLADAALASPQPEPGLAAGVSDGSDGGDALDRLIAAARDRGPR